MNKDPWERFRFETSPEARMLVQRLFTSCEMIDNAVEDRDKSALRTAIERNVNVWREIKEHADGTVQK